MQTEIEPKIIDIQFREVRIRYVCPNCEVDVWMYQDFFSSKRHKEVKQRCWHCGEYVSFTIEACINENKDDTKNL